MTQPAVEPSEAKQHSHTGAKDVQAGKGLAGELLKDERMATNVSQIAQNLSITTSNLNRLGIWGVFWQHKPPKAKELPPHQLKTPKDLSE